MKKEIKNKNLEEEIKILSGQCCAMNNQAIERAIWKIIEKAIKLLKN